MAAEEERPDWSKYPQVKDVSMIGHPPGWDAAVVGLLEKMSPGSVVRQTKSKFNTARFYVSGTEEDQAHASAAERIAEASCRRCGGPVVAGGDMCAEHEGWKW